MEIRYSKSAMKFLEKLDKPTKQQIEIAILGLTEKPPKGDIKALVSYTDGRQRLRVGKYRVVFTYKMDGTIEVLLIMDIDSRGSIYKRRTRT
ncbi:MAG: type II toxin-antitoxin system RelE/ParE family toxin [Oscillibacter sp.]|nr:type II toxin-antitoxin system RelE/ParE family toxin [Oscillibacter sp.]